MDLRHRAFVVAAAAAACLLVPLPATSATPTSPVPATDGEWLAGDLHVHTCFSHDAYCGPDDDNTGPEELYTLSGDVGMRFAEAAVRGLDFLAITDHNDLRSTSHPGFGAHGVIPISGYEASLDGHAQVLGATAVLPAGEGAAGVAALAEALRAGGGVFQINHPGEGVTDPITSCAADELAALDWSYGTAVVPDTVEVWNIGHHVQPPVPSGTSNDDSERLWECFLQAGHHVAATGGSDSHWLATTAVQGVGTPTTWVRAADRTPAGVLAGVRAGRTSITLRSPLLGGAPLLLEADADGDGTYESVIGDTVPAGSAMRVRSADGRTVGVVQVRANGATIVDKPTASLDGVRFRAPSAPGWVRATLLVLPPLTGLDGLLCRNLDATPLATTYCRNKLLVAGLTSPIYLG